MEWAILAVVLMEVLMVVYTVPVQAKEKFPELDPASNDSGISSCEKDEDCDEDNFEMCCFDLSSPSSWTNDPNPWRKKCCNNPSGSPIIEPPANLTEPQMEKLDKGISYLAPYMLDFVVCEGIPYSTMLQVPSCESYITTTEMASKLHQTAGATTERVAMVLNMVITMKIIAFLK